MKLKNEIFRWLIVLICGFETYRLVKTIVSSISSYKQQMAIVSGENDLVNTIKYATPVQMIINLILIATFLFVIYYFVFCFGKQNKTKLLGVTLLVQAACLIVLFINSNVINFKTVWMFDFDSYGIYPCLSAIFSALKFFVEISVLLLVSIAIFKNIQNNKSLKITCSILFVLYIIFEFLHTYSIAMFYYTFSDNAESIMSVIYSQINIISMLSVFLDLYIVLYVLFMDKDYRIEKNNG